VSNFKTTDQLSFPCLKIHRQNVRLCCRSVEHFDHRAQVFKPGATWQSYN